MYTLTQHDLTEYWREGIMRGEVGVGQSVVERDRGTNKEVYSHMSGRVRREFKEYWRTKGRVFGWSMKYNNIQR